jgi:2-amino-4-hydroxy-6-hydroxymethyldihydropteridine diphosphokinase
MSEAVLSIGSNLGDRLANLQAAVDAFRPWLRAVSPVYETPPWGPVAQPEYLNAVVLAADPGANPAEWLARAQAAERAALRVRDVRWGPRTLDVDIVAVDDVQTDDPELTLPHPRAGQRAFVLIPWRDVDPGAALAGRPLDVWLAELPAADVAGVRPTGSTLR